MQLEIQVGADAVADVIAGVSSHPETKSLIEAARKAGLTLHPRHPGTRDPALRTWFYADVPPGRDADVCAALLRAHPPISAAFSKPPEALP